MVADKETDIIAFIGRGLDTDPDGDRDDLSLRTTGRSADQGFDKYEVTGRADITATQIRQAFTRLKGGDGQQKGEKKKKNRNWSDDHRFQIYSPWRKIPRSLSVLLLIVTDREAGYRLKIYGGVALKLLVKADNLLCLP